MLRTLYIFSCWACLFSGSFAEPLCASGASTWTSWFNTQDPANNQGNDVEDVSLIRSLYEEAARCTTVLHMEHSIVNAPLGNATHSQRVSISKDGVFCSGTPEVPCANYQVRFCCLMTRQVLPSQCGRTFFPPNLQASLRIVNGLESVPHSFPWSVSLQYRGVHDCGGVILDQRHILTAAHCLDYATDLPNYQARVGAHDRRSSGQLIPVAQLILHPQYNQQRSTNDIGIIRLAAPITFTQQIQPICLADQVRWHMFNSLLDCHDAWRCCRSSNHPWTPLRLLPVGATRSMGWPVVVVQFFVKLGYVSLRIARCILPMINKDNSALPPMGLWIRIMGLFCQRSLIL